MNYLIVDGYNILNKFPKLKRIIKSNFDLARDQLYKVIQGYCDRKDLKGIIVFDGKGEGEVITDSNPAVIFSKKGETADTVIESLVSKLIKDCQVTVVTDDRIHANFVTGLGAFILTSKLLRLELESSSRSLSEYIEQNNDEFKHRIKIGKIGGKS